ncbi:hypothetical protein ElyMa_003330800 [Elysia marginata]|uniref:Uncharacterized protein n=1 Tax=Elysia marginata TaxID=1093978 RepID=A0AAV4JGV5_9GAST|nr:hypothetical protein ElyMa_003330800 [Elysia marginata]
MIESPCLSPRPSFDNFPHSLKGSIVVGQRRSSFRTSRGPRVDRGAMYPIIPEVENRCSIGKMGRLARVMLWNSIEDNAPRQERATDDVRDKTNLVKTFRSLSLFLAIQIAAAVFLRLSCRT